MYVGQWYGFSQVCVRWRYALLSCVTPLMYFELTEASETNRLCPVYTYPIVGPDGARWLNQQLSL